MFADDCVVELEIGERVSKNSSSFEALAFVSRGENVRLSSEQKKTNVINIFFHPRPNHLASPAHEDEFQVHYNFTNFSVTMFPD